MPTRKVPWSSVVHSFPKLISTQTPPLCLAATCQYPMASFSFALPSAPPASQPSSQIDISIPIRPGPLTLPAPT